MIKLISMKQQLKEAKAVANAKILKAVAKTDKRVAKRSKKDAIINKTDKVAKQMLKL